MYIEFIKAFYIWTFLHSENGKRFSWGCRELQCMSSVPLSLEEVRKHPGLTVVQCCMISVLRLYACGTFSCVSFLQPSIYKWKAVQLGLSWIAMYVFSSIITWRSQKTPWSYCRTVLYDKCTPSLCLWNLFLCLLSTAVNLQMESGSVGVVVNCNVCLQYHYHLKKSENTLVLLSYSAVWYVHSVFMPVEPFPVSPF